MKKLFVVVLCSVIALLGVFAQGSSEKQKDVSICTPYMSSVTTKQDVDVMTAIFEEAGIKVSVFDSANDLSKLASDIESATISHTGAIIIVSVDPNLVSAQINDAIAAGIPVFGVDAGYMEGMQLNVTSDNYQMGVQMCEYLFDAMGDEGTLVHLTYRAHPGVVKRTYALEDEIVKHPNINYIHEYHCDVPNQINNAKEIVENLLTAYPEKGSITSIFCAWDEPAIGATQALMEAGRDEVIVVGVDGNEQAIQLIQQGTNLKATLSQDFDGMSKLCAEECVKLLNGEECLQGEQYVPALLIEKN